MKCEKCPFYELGYKENFCHKLHLQNFLPQDRCDMGLVAKASPTFKKRLIEDGFLHTFWIKIRMTDVGEEMADYLWWMDDETRTTVQNVEMILNFSDEGIEVECTEPSTWIVCMIPWELIDADTIYELRLLLVGKK